MYGNKSNNWCNETSGRIANYCMHMSVPVCIQKFWEQRQHNTYGTDTDTLERNDAPKKCNKGGIS